MALGKKSLKTLKMIFHLAALADIVPSIKYPDKYFDANVTGTKNIINNANKYNVKKLFIQLHLPATDTKKISHK